MVITCLNLAPLAPCPVACSSSQSLLVGTVGTGSLFRFHLHIDASFVPSHLSIDSLPSSVFYWTNERNESENYEMKQMNFIEEKGEFLTFPRQKQGVLNNQHPLQRTHKNLVSFFSG